MVTVTGTVRAQNERHGKQNRTIRPPKTNTTITYFTDVGFIVFSLKLRLTFSGVIFAQTAP